MSNLLLQKKSIPVNDGKALAVLDVDNQGRPVFYVLINKASNKQQSEKLAETIIDKLQPSARTLAEKYEVIQQETIALLLKELEKYNNTITSEDQNFEFTGTSTFEELKIETIFPNGIYVAEGEEWTLRHAIENGGMPLFDAIVLAEELQTINTSR